MNGGRPWRTALLVADVLADLLTPDRAKTHALDLRLGVLYDATTQAGLQAAFDLFAGGQTIEANCVSITSLQPSRSTGPQVGIILSTYQ